ncbi:integrase core domain-containing protein [Streptomyces sp. V4I8]|uniref:integrase core domain-containing protein n=1 Tax=Streptomyces sp. V4I8 TaxID=3156469 RepID=UPI003518487F
MHLHADAEGPTFISTTAWRPFVSVFYIRSSQSPSGHTNAAAESFHSSIKVEYIHRHRFATHTEARLKIATWITDFFNTRRRHSAAGGLPPTEFEQIINQKRAEAHSRTQAA